MTRWKARYRAIRFGVVLAVFASSLAVMSPARAATSLGSLAFTPATGLSTSPISMTTVSSGASKGCPDLSTNVSGYVTGPGGWATGILGVGNTSTGVSLTSDFTSELSDTFSGLAQSNSVTLVPGKYTVTLYCQNRFGTTQYGEFSAPIWFTDATHYQATDPAAPPPTPAPTPSPTFTPTPAPTPTSGEGAAATAVTLAATPAGTAVVSSDVTLTATVTPAGAQGSVTFLDGTGAAALALGSAQLFSGTAIFTTAGLAVGDHSITASFVPADPGAFRPSQSGALPYSITAAPASGALGSVVLLPATGLSTSPISMTTRSAGAAKGCPAPSTNIAGYVTGPGDWASGILGVNNSSSGVSLTSDFTVELADTFSGLAQSNSVTLVPGKYTITVYCQNRFGTIRYGEFSAPVWFTDATHYQSNDPDSSQSVTQTVVTASPADRSQVGAKVTFTAVVTPATATGSVQFRDNRNGTYGSLGDPVPIVDGKGAMTSSSLLFGLYQVSAVFTPANVGKFGSSASEDVVFAVALPIPPLPPRRAVITGKVKVGSTLSCQASFKNATSMSYQWIRDRTTIVGGSGNSYRLVAADGGHAVRCRALATNSGGTTSRTSSASKVAR